MGTFYTAPIQMPRPYTTMMGGQLGAAGTNLSAKAAWEKGGSLGIMITGKGSPDVRCQNTFSNRRKQY